MEQETIDNTPQETIENKEIISAEEQIKQIKYNTAVEMSKIQLLEMRLKHEREMMRLKHEHEIKLLKIKHGLA